MERLNKISAGQTRYLLAWLLFLFAAVAQPQIVRAADVSIQMEPVCQNWPTPTGYVIVGVQLSQSCNAPGTGYAYVVDLPSEGLTVCNNRAQPAPYVVTNQKASNNCAPLFNESVIRSAADGLAICGDEFSPIPDGYIVTSATNTDKTTCLGANIYRLSVAANGAVMCNFSARPSGYVVNHVNSSNQCIGASSYTLQSVFPGVVACSFSRAPDGYVVTSGTKTLNCTDGDLHGDYWTYNEPFSGIVVCPFSPVPAGYYLTGTVNKNDCYGANFGYVLKQL